MSMALEVVLESEALVGKILALPKWENFEFWKDYRRENFEIFPPEIFETRVLFENEPVIKCTDLVVEAWQRVDHAVVVRAAVSC